MCYQVQWIHFKATFKEVIENREVSKSAALSGGPDLRGTAELSRSATLNESCKARFNFFEVVFSGIETL